MMDENGRVWPTSRIRPDANPAFCKEGSKHASAKFPMNTSRRQLQMYDPATKKTTLDTCYDASPELRSRRQDLVLERQPERSGGRFDTKKWDETHDEAQSQAAGRRSSST